MSSTPLRRFDLTLLAILCSCLILDGQEHTRFAWLSDLHYSEGSASARDLSVCIHDIGTIDSLDFVLVSGDLTDFGADNEIARVKLMLDSLVIPYHAIPGNHDAKWSESGSNTFAKVFGSESFDFRAGGFRFIGCASGPDMRMTPALIPRSDMARLRSLEESAPTIFVNHYPLDSSVLNYGEIRVLLREMDTRAVLGGHWHVNRVMDYDGLPGILCRSTMSKGETPCGYNIVDITDGRLTISERRPLEGSLTQWHTMALDSLPKPSEPQLDAFGLPRDYPWTRYDINDKWPEVRTLWSRRDDCGTASGFAVSGRRAWYVTMDGHLNCIDTRSGKNLWQAELPGKAFSTPCCSSGLVVVGCAAGGLYAFKARSGKLKWIAPTGKAVLSSPVVFKRMVFFGASDGIFRSVRLRDGSKVWEFKDVDGFVEDRAWVDGSQVIFGSWGRKLYCLSTSDGSLQWVWDVGKSSRMYSPAACNPVKTEGKVFVAVPDRKVHILDAATGEELSSADGGRECLCLSADGTRIYVKTMYSGAYCLSPDGRKLWDVRTPLGYDISPTSPLETNSGIIIPGDKGNIWCFSAEDGSLLWGHKVSLALVNPLYLLPDGSVLLSTMDGFVQRLRLPE